MSARSKRRGPNICVSGTPGTGKSTLCKKLVEREKRLRLLDITAEAKSRGYLNVWDDKLKCHVLDSDKVTKELEPELIKGGVVIDYMYASIWSSKVAIDLCITMRSDTKALFERYTSRGYENTKIQENLDSEIMREIVDENMEYFEPEDEEATATCIELSGDSEEDLKSNLDSISAWIKKWYEGQQSGDDETLMPFPAP